MVKITHGFFTLSYMSPLGAWPIPVTGSILNKTTGFAALMKFLRDTYLNKAVPGEMVSVAQFQSIFKKNNLRDEDFMPDNYKPGGTGESQL